MDDGNVIEMKEHLFMLFPTHMHTGYSIIDKYV